VIKLCARRWSPAGRTWGSRIGARIFPAARWVPKTSLM